MARRKKSQRNEFPFIPAYMGISTFMHTPHTRDLKGVDMAVVGIPFDSGAASWRSGTRFGPRRVRENSQQIWGAGSQLNIAPTHERKVIDYGVILCDPTNIDRTAEAITTDVAKILSANVKVMAIGGDHSISYPLLRAHAQKYGPLAVVHFDSHPDTYPTITHDPAYAPPVQARPRWVDSTASRC